MDLSKIKKIVEEKGITLKSVCDKIEMSQNNLHKCIRDNRIEAGVLEKIANVLNVHVSYFFDAPEPALTERDEELIEVQRKYIASLEMRLQEYGDQLLERAC